MTDSEQSAPEGLLAGVLAGALWCLPAAWRAADGLLAWLALVGSAALVMGPLVVSTRALTPVLAGARSASFAFALAAGPLALLAAALETRTHHRPLGGVTFAVIAAAGIVGSLVAMHRLERGSRIPLMVARGVALASLALAVAWLVPALGLEGVRASCIDAALGLVLVILAARVRIPLGPSAARAAPWVWAVVVVAGLGAMRVRGGSDLAAAAPAVAALGSWIVPGGA